MARFRVPLLASLLLVSVAFAAILPGSGDAQTVNHVVISEVLYDAPQGGTDTVYEWIELYNPTGGPIDLTGWVLEDNNSSDAIPQVTLAAGQYLVVAATMSGFLTNHPGFTGRLISLDDGSGSIGNGLANTGDRVILWAPNDLKIDSMSYGGDTSEFNPALERVKAAGQSLARSSPWLDTNTAADWTTQASPNPGEGPTAPTSTPTSTSTFTSTSTTTPTSLSTSTPTASASPSPTATVSPSATPSPTVTASASPIVSPSPTPSATVSPSPTLTATPTPTGTLTPAPTATSTPTPSATPTATATASPTATGTEAATPTPTVTPTGTPRWTSTALPRLRLNEFLPRPVQIDWNGDGEINTGDEWIEIVNLDSTTADLSGWALDDMAAGGTKPYTFTVGMLLPPGHFLWQSGKITGVGLNNDGDVVRLLAPDGAEVDTCTYTRSTSDGSYSRAVDGTGPWVDTYPPSPGSPNLPPTPTPSPTASVTAAITASPTMTATTTRTAIPSRTPTSTSTPTATPSEALAGSVVINEVMQNPNAVEDSRGEFIELFNATHSAIDLNGWILRDLGGDRHRIDTCGPLWLPARGYLVLGRDADPATNGGVPVTYRYTGFSLGNDDDEVILEDGAGQEIDRVVYNSAGGFPDPSGASMALISPDRDNAVGGNWRASFTAWTGSAGDLGSPGAANPVPPAQIEGHVFEDLDGNRHRDVGEPGIAGVIVNLSTGSAIRTDANGWYGFYGLSAGSYVITELQPAGFTSTTPDELTVTVGPAEISWGHDFGERRPATVTPSPTPTGQPMTWPRLLLSEVFYDAPQSGTDSDYEFIELWNGGVAAVDLAGWRLRDNTSEDALPAFTLNPGEFVVVAAAAAGFAANFPGFAGHIISLEGSLGGGLGNGGDRVILLAPDGTVVDAMSYGDDSTVFPAPCPDVPVGASLARVPTAQDTGSAADWVAQMSPNPGQPGSLSQPTPTTTASAWPTVSPTRAVTHTPSPSPTASPAWTPTPTWTPTATSDLRPNVRLNEVLPRPAQIDWDGDSAADQYDEWVEIINLGPDAAALDGWRLDDIRDGGSQPYVIPAGTLLLSGDFLVLFRRQTGIALNNDGDSARLVAPDGAEVDNLSYTAVEPDASYSRMIDGTGDWTQAYPPSPGRSNRPAAPSATPTASPSATATPTGIASSTPTPSPTATPFSSAIYLNEILPEPAADWNGDGDVDSQDEFVELYNFGAFAVNLGGWAVADDTNAYTLPLGTMIWPYGFLTLYRSQMHRSLGNDQDALSLWRPDGTLADGFMYAVGPGPDRSYCRHFDGIGAWVRGCQPTPGEANRLAPPPTPKPANGKDDMDFDSRTAALLTIAAARAAPIGAWITIAGSVTLPPGVFSRRIYLEDESGGIGVYLRRGEYPPLALGDRVSATGRVGSNYGEAEIEVSTQSRLVMLGASVTPTARRLRTGEVGEAHEGRLAWVFGRAVSASHTTVTLDDGTGLIAIYFPEGLAWRRPYVKLGDYWAAQGVIGQHAARAPYVGGYRLIPRLASDFSQAPLFLPVTGGALP